MDWSKALNTASQIYGQQGQGGGQGGGQQQQGGNPFLAQEGGGGGGGIMDMLGGGGGMGGLASLLGGGGLGELSGIKIAQQLLQQSPLMALLGGVLQQGGGDQQGEMGDPSKFTDEEYGRAQSDRKNRYGDKFTTDFMSVMEPPPSIEGNGPLQRQYWGQ